MRDIKQVLPQSSLSAGLSGKWVCTTEEILPYIWPLLYAFLRHLLLGNKVAGCADDCGEIPWLSWPILVDCLLSYHWLVLRHKRKDKASRQGCFPWILFQAPLVYSALYFLVLRALLPQICPLSLIWGAVAKPFLVTETRWFWVGLDKNIDCRPLY